VNKNRHPGLRQRSDRGDQRPALWTGLSGWRSRSPYSTLAKGFLPAFLSRPPFPDSLFPAVCASLAVAPGTAFPIYIGFKGGKGVASAGRAMLALAPLAALGCLAVFIGAVSLTRYISLASILAALAFPLYSSLLLGAPGPFLLWTLPLVAIIWIRHAANIGRLIRRREPNLERRRPSHHERGVVGGGSWGSAFALYLGRLGFPTRLWIRRSRHFPVGLPRPGKSDFFAGL